MVNLRRLPGIVCQVSKFVHSTRMKCHFSFSLFFAMTVSMVLGQVEIPSNPLVKPGRTTTRPTGGGIDSGTKIDPGNPDGKVRYVTYVVLYDTRIWTSSDGKPVEAKLIAFEDLIVEGAKDSAAAKMPSPPEKPTVIDQSKARLLVRGKPMVVELARLSNQDQELILGIQAAIQKKAETVKKAAAGSTAERK